jgi:hypothetical protein
VDTRTKETTFINKVAPLNLLLKAAQGKFRRKDIGFTFLIILITFHYVMTLKMMADWLKCLRWLPFQITRLWAWAIPCGNLDFV